MSYLTQMLGMTVQDFILRLSGCGARGLIRGMRGVRGKTIGNFWVDLNRRHPLYSSAAHDSRPSAYCSQGVPQTFKTSYTVSCFSQPKIQSMGKAVNGSNIATGRSPA